MSDFIMEDAYRVFPAPKHHVEDRDQCTLVAYEHTLYRRDDVLDEGDVIGIPTFNEEGAEAHLVPTADCRFIRVKPICIPLIPIYRQ